MADIAGSDGDTSSASASPSVSIIVATYNRLPLLRQTVDSVLAQTFIGWELILADDGSTDGTREYLDDLAANDARVRPLFLEHVGSMTAMRTAGIEAMRGEWIALLDSDDLWAPQKLEVQLQNLREHPECWWSYTGYHHIDEAGQLPRPESGWILDKLISLSVASAPQTLVMRRRLFEECGGFDHALYVRSDYDLMLRMAMRSPACGVSDDLAMVRQHPARTTNGFPISAQLDENEAMFRRALSNATDPHIRVLCAQQCAAQYIEKSRLHQREGRRLASWVSLAAAVRLAPLAHRTWRGVLAQAARQIGLRS